MTASNIELDELEIRTYTRFENNILIIGGYYKTKVIVLVVKSAELVAEDKLASAKMWALHYKYEGFIYSVLGTLGIGFDYRQKKRFESRHQFKDDLKNRIKSIGYKYYLDENEQGVSEEVIDMFESMKPQTFEHRLEQIQNHMDKAQTKLGITESSEVIYFQIEYLDRLLEREENSVQYNRENPSYTNSNVWGLGRHHYAALRFIDQLKEWKGSLVNKEITENSNATNVREKRQNPNPRIFKEVEGFLILEQWFDSYDKKKELAEASYILRKLIEEDLIYRDVKHETLITFVSDEFDVDIDRLKTLVEAQNIARDNLFRLIYSQLDREK
jgi:hypothetical protein